MRAVITVVGKDAVGILAKVSGVCAQRNANVVEVSQSVLQELFAMIMLVEIDNLSIRLSELGDELAALGDHNGLVIHVMHEDLFNSMHRI